MYYMYVRCYQITYISWSKNQWNWLQKFNERIKRYIELEATNKFSMNRITNRTVCWKWYGKCGGRGFCWWKLKFRVSAHARTQLHFTTTFYSLVIHKNFTWFSYDIILYLVKYVLFFTLCGLVFLTNKILIQINCL